MGFGLDEYQLEAIERMRNGCILCGGVGSGKTRTALGYYYKECGGDIYSYDHTSNGDLMLRDLYVITTARKRDDKDWETEMLPFCLVPKTSKSFAHYHIATVDSWNNILKYRDVRDAFFIFDEQRVGGHGTWAKTFLKIAKNNKWILLSATPGDCWDDYVTVFIANGYFRSRYDFDSQHVILKRFVSYRSVDRYYNEGVLIKYRNSLLVDINFSRKTKRHYEIVECTYDIKAYKDLIKTRWDPYDDCPIENGSKLYYLQRKIGNSSEDRQAKLLEILEDHPKVIIFYNYDYELDILKMLLEAQKVPFNEWNGHNHDPIPSGEKWAYLVQYTAGNEGWNCIQTDTIIFYSQHPSYKVLEQASGRIDRRNTPYTDLYYYRLKSNSPLDIRMNTALIHKKNFNQRDLVKSYDEKFFSYPKEDDIVSDPLPDSFYEEIPLFY